MQVIHFLIHSFQHTLYIIKWNSCGSISYLVGPVWILINYKEFVRKNVFRKCTASTAHILMKQFFVNFGWQRCKTTQGSIKSSWSKTITARNKWSKSKRISPRKGAWQTKLVDSTGVAVANLVYFVCPEEKAWDEHLTVNKNITYAY